jgi:hypothetical protein
MLVPDMASHEEEKLYQAGIETVGGLARSRGLAGGDIPAQRLAVLRRNAQRLLGQRVRLGFGLAAIVVVALGLGAVSRRLYIPSHHPKAGTPVKVEEARAEGLRTGERR